MCVQKKAAHLSRPSADKVQYVGVNKHRRWCSVDHEAALMYSRYRESRWQLSLVYESQLSYDQVRERVCCQRGAEGMQGLITLALLAIILSEQSGEAADDMEKQRICAINR